MADIRIQDDLYNHVNKEWLDQAVIPDDKPTAGGFAELAKGIEETMLKEFQDMSKSENCPTPHMKQAVALYRLALDADRRAKDGAKPAFPYLQKIQQLNSIEDLNANLKEFVLYNYPLPFYLSVEEDMMDTSSYCLNIKGPSVILPDSKYYKKEMAQQKAQFLGLWQNMAKAVMAQSPLSQQEQELYIKDTLAFDELLAKYVKNMEEWSDYVSSYNPVKASKVYSMVAPVELKSLLEKIVSGNVEKIIVTEPRYFKNFKKVFNKNTFELYKHWAYVLTLVQAATDLSEELRETGTSYSRGISGIAAMPSVEKYAYQYASRVFSEPIGLYYGQKYFGEEAKKDVVEMVKSIVETYKNRIQRNDFLSEPTKQKAILKLSTMGLKMAYPDKCDKIYDKLTVDESKSLLENAYELYKVITEDMFAKYGTKVDRSKWVMPGHMVNACYNPNLNDITFPAAILQAPFYSIKQTRSQNLGGIGAVIAHEISHAFDNNGAKFDENGNLKNWWTKKDNKEFLKRTEAMAKEFDGIELPWGKVNGKFIVSENIADNGGMGATLEVMSHTENADYEEYFKNWARVWCMKAKEEYLKLILSVDVHAPSILRANMQPRNFEEWYKTFDVKETDGMYLAPENRVTIW